MQIITSRTSKNHNRFSRRLIEKSPVIPATLILAIALVQMVCKLTSSRNLQDMRQVVERIGEEYVPDSRVDLYHVDLERQNGHILVRGEMLNPKLSDLLLDSLRYYFSNANFINDITVFPHDSLGSQNYGIVNISVANIRRDPRFQAELVNQTLLGTVVRIYKEQNGFYYVQNWDRYLGWLSKSSVVVVDSITASNWQNAPQVVCIANYGIVVELAGATNDEFIVDLVPGATLKRSDARSGFVKVETPDGRIGFVDESLVVDKHALEMVQATQEKIIQTSRQFLGVPYLWGGTSAKGFDCSGFVQTVFRLNNLKLPRDASQMVDAGEEIEPGDGFENLVPGDLLFFGSKPDRISHVGIYMGEQLYIHSSTSVHINSLDTKHPLYNNYRHKTFRKAKRIL